MFVRVIYWRWEGGFQTIARAHAHTHTFHFSRRVFRGPPGARAGVHVHFGVVVEKARGVS